MENRPSRSLRPALLRAAQVLCLAGLGIALAGCAAGHPLALLLAVLFAAGAAGCSTSHDPPPADAGPVTDGTIVGDAGGDWGPCCNVGRVSSCFCPAGWACNYGWYTDCGDGTCVDLDMMCPVYVDGGTADAGGTWEPCCVDGRVDSCFCPGGAECNYGLFDYCSDGSCVLPGETCGAQDAGVADAGGYWEPCCVDNLVTTCLCPHGVACNYGWYTDCGDGTCVADPTGMCPP